MNVTNNINHVDVTYSLDLIEQEHFTSGVLLPEIHISPVEPGKNI